LYKSRKIQLVKDIEILESYLYENKIAEGKEHITAKTKNRQDEMRLRVFNAEKDYLELIYKCNLFLGAITN
jgi:hypothetical protein